MACWVKGWSRTARRGGRKSRQGADQEVWETKEELGLYPWKKSGISLERSLWMLHGGQLGQVRQGAGATGQRATAMSRGETAEVGHDGRRGKGEMLQGQSHLGSEATRSRLCLLPAFYLDVMGSRRNPVCQGHGPGCFVPPAKQGHLPPRQKTRRASPLEAVRWLLRATFRWHMAKRSAPTSGTKEGHAIKRQPSRHFYLRAYA